MEFPCGLLNLNITGLNKGTTIKQTVTYPVTLSEDTRFYKCNPDRGGWLDITKYVDFNPGDNTATLTITDNGFLDTNPKDGVINDPFGPAKKVKEPATVPTISEWGMITLPLLLAGAAVWFVRRKWLIS